MSELHSTRVITALIPRYVSRFTCIGSTCEDNCCTGWNVSIDKKTYQAYQKTIHTALGSDLSKNLQRAKNRENNATYAHIKLHPKTRECPFMEERLCAIQKNLGETFLSDTCFSYPRFTKRFAGQYEIALMLSCPEAARHALLAEDAFEFVEGPVTMRINATLEVAPRLGMPIELMNEVRIYCMQLLQTQGLELWEKLAVLGGFCEALTTTLKTSGNAAVPDLLESYIAIVEKGLVKEALTELQPDHAAQAGVFTKLWQCKTTENWSVANRSALYKAVLGDVARGLGADDETGSVSLERLVENYSRGLRRMHEALEAAPKILEHYLLNEMFLELFPFREPSPYQSYLKLISRFGLLRLMLAGQCNADAALPDAVALARTVQVYCRRFQHDQMFAQNVGQALNNTGWVKLENLYRFLRT